jgi:outer membrane protein assembly factor BamB
MVDAHERSCSQRHHPNRRCTDLDLGVARQDRDQRGGAAVGRDGTIYLGTFNGEMVALRRNGTLKWALPATDSVNATPAILLDGRIAFVDEGGPSPWSTRPARSREGTRPGRGSAAPAELQLSGGMAPSTPESTRLYTPSTPTARSDGSIRLGDWGQRWRWAMTGACTSPRQPADRPRR